MKDIPASLAELEKRTEGVMDEIVRGWSDEYQSF